VPAQLQPPHQPPQLPTISLHMAADYHLPDICADMCQRTPEDIAKVNEKGFVPFFLAGMKGHTEMVAAIHEAALRHFGA
jgi:ankyrin repeat protein